MKFIVNLNTLVFYGKINVKSSMSLLEIVQDKICLDNQRWQ